MTALLPVIDDFDRCLVELNKQENKELTEGVVLIKDKFVAVLDQKGLKPMQVKAGDEFNAIYMRPSLKFLHLKKN